MYKKRENEDANIYIHSRKTRHGNFLTCASSLYISRSADRSDHDFWSNPSTTPLVKSFATSSGEPHTTTPLPLPKVG